MAPKKPRRLRAEEEELWKKVAETATPLQKPAPIELPLQPKARAKPAQAPTPIPSFTIGEKAGRNSVYHDIAPGIGQRLKDTPVQMDNKSFARMKRGKLKPEARIDLHGMTLAQAHPALNRFIANAYSNGLRLVLVITGKGKTKSDPGPIPTRQGVLKHQVPDWLRAPGLAHFVLQVTEAHLRHGGSGAYYVYLRRHR